MFHARITKHGATRGAAVLKNPRGGIKKSMSWCKIPAQYLMLLLVAQPQQMICLSCALITDFGVDAGPLMGVGSFARVYRAEWSGAPVAVKVILHRGGAVEANIEREALLSTDLRHPNVVQGFQYATRTVDIACGLSEVRELLQICQL